MNSDRERSSVQRLRRRRERRFRAFDRRHAFERSVRAADAHEGVQSFDFVSFYKVQAIGDSESVDDGVVRRRIELEHVAGDAHEGE